MRRALGIALIVGLALSGCSGGEAKKKPEADMPLPAKPPALTGEAAGPALVPKVLLASADELEARPDGLSPLISRRAGAFVSGGTIVAYSVDDISGYDARSGDKSWTSDLDLGGGTVCFTSQPDRKVKTFTVAYGTSSRCGSIATIRVSDGKALSTHDLDGQMVGDRFAGTSTERMITVDGTDLLIDDRGIGWRVEKGLPKPLRELESSYRDAPLVLAAGGSLIVGVRSGDNDSCTIDAYSLPSLELAWTTSTTQVFPDLTEECEPRSAGSGLAVLPGDGVSILLGGDDAAYMAELDVKTGEVMKTAVDIGNDGPPPPGIPDIGIGSLYADDVVAVAGGDVVMRQFDGLGRFSLRSSKRSWVDDLASLQLASDIEDAEPIIVPKGLTPDGKHVIVAMSNQTSVDILAVETSTGRLVGRWPVPEEFRNGFQVLPGVTVIKGGVVLTRNFEEWESTFNKFTEVPAPAGDRYDIGVFMFPDAAPDPQG